MALKHVKPNEALSRELEDVAREVRTLTGFLGAPNRPLPDGFRPISFANYAIHLRICLTGRRRDVVPCSNMLGSGFQPFVASTSAAKKKSIRSTTMNRRMSEGGALDRQLRDLFGSVATALDEYRVQATAHFDDAVGPEPIADPIGMSGVGDAVSQSPPTSEPPDPEGKERDRPRLESCSTRRGGGEVRS